MQGHHRYVLICMSESPGVCVNFSSVFFTARDGKAHSRACVSTLLPGIMVSTPKAPSRKTVASTETRSSERHESIFPLPACKLLKTRSFLTGNCLLEPPHLPRSSSETHLQRECKKINLPRLFHLNFNLADHLPSQHLFC